MLNSSPLSMEDQITLLASQSLPGDCIATLMGISQDSLYKNKSFSNAFKKGQQNCKATLYRAQFHTATVELNPTMQIWLGKQRLGQKDKDVTTGKDRLEELYRARRKALTANADS